jgi:6-phosphogluconolactonase (cycloisomerase 2 family)
MKFSKMSQLFLVSSIGLLVATLLTACQIVTIDFVFLASSAASGTAGDGQIFTYAVDSQSGALRTGGTTISSGGTYPVAMAVSPDYANLYVANQANNTLVHFTISLGGVLTQKDVVTLSNQGSTPVAIAVSASGTYLFVASASYPGATGPLAGGALAVFPLSGGTIGTAVANGPLSYWPLNLSGFSGDLIVPTGVTVLANSSAVFVTAYDKSAYNPGGSAASSANPGWVFGYTIGTGGALSQAAGGPFQAGTKPTALVADPTNRFVYVTDFANNTLIGYSLHSGNSLSYLINGPFKTGNEPTAITVDPRGKYLYVANSLDNSVSAYAIDLSTGSPSVAVNPTANAGNNTDTQPVAILVDPALGRFVYTANFLGNSVSGFRLDPNAGGLVANQATPYPSGAKPTAIASVPHGNHSIQSVTP